MKISKIIEIIKGTYHYKKLAKKTSIKKLSNRDCCLIEDYIEKCRKEPSKENLINLAHMILMCTYFKEREDK